MRPYRLAQDSHVCATSQGAVFLDLKRDTYFGVDVQQAEALAGLVEGWPRSQMTETSAASLIERRTLADSLCERGLLSPSHADDAEHGTTSTRASERNRTVLPVTDELLPWDQMPRARIRPHHVFTFLCALTRACWMLHCRSLHAVVLRRRARRPGHDHTPENTLTCNLLSIYTLLRMLAFARRGRCLLDSIVLVEFLAAYGVHAEWVIGVHVRPFSAHSWVQHAQYVLNGTPAFVRHFKPILVT